MNLISRPIFQSAAPTEVSLGECHFSIGSASASPQGYRVGADSRLGQGPTQLYVSCLWDLGLVVSFHSMKTDIKHLP